MSAPRFMLDEHVWAGLIKVGERIGADVVSVQMLIPQGSSDEDVLALAAEAKRILLTSMPEISLLLRQNGFLSAGNTGGSSLCRGRPIAAC